MPRRPTLHDLAQAAGVGVATVDRVLNGRPHVRAATVERVLAAAERIGYPTRRLVERQRDAARRRLRFGFVLHKASQEFYRSVAAELTAAVAARTDIRGQTEIRYSPSQAPGDFAAELRAMAETADVVATSAINHPEVTAAIRDLHAAGRPVIALLNDVASGLRQGYVGLDNMQVGRLAAWMITTRVRDPGKLCVFVGGNRWHGHILRETGFRSFLRERAPGFGMLDTVVNLETRQVSYEATIDLLARHPDLRGIYVAGGGMEGAIAALREARPPERIALVVNELTAESRRALTDGYVTMVIATPLAELGRALVETMIAAVEAGPGAHSAPRILTPQLYLPESF